MKISGKLSGQIRKVTNTLNKANDGITAVAEFVTRVRREDCARMFGGEFALFAFGSVIERTMYNGKGEEDGLEFVDLEGARKPSAKIVVEMHKVSIFGRTITGVQPALKVEPVQGEDKVDVVVFIPVDVGTDDAADLALIRSPKTGTTIVEFNAQQGGFEFKVKEGDVAETTERLKAATRSLEEAAAH